MTQTNFARGVVFFFILSVGFACFTGCNTNTTRSITSIKLSVVSKYSSVVQVSVYLEGMDGNYVSGARVLAINPAHQVQVLGFSNTAGCYYGIFNDLLSGPYTIEVYSSLVGPEGKEYVVEHKIPQGASTITQCSDASGNNTLIGQEVNAVQDISLRWTALDNASLYVLQINQGYLQAYSSSVLGNSLIIPANTLSPGSYTVKLSAQWLSGDPYLVSSDTYSVSQSQSSSFSLIVK